jgi:hypothetical protein
MSESDYLSLVFGVLFALSEGLAYYPKVKANSIFQLLQAVFYRVYRSLL